MSVLAPRSPPAQRATGSACRRKAATLTLGWVLFAGAGAAADSPDAFVVNQLIGRGVNIGNALEAPVEGEWGVTIEREHFDLIRAAGFNSVRIAACWSAHALDEPPFTIDRTFFKRIDEVINQAGARAGVVILTMHHFGLYDRRTRSWHRELLDAVVPPATAAPKGS